MKKIMAVLAALCLVLLSVPALAEFAQADGNPIALDGFTLYVDAGTYYQLNEKGANQVYILVYPDVAGGDLTTNYNAVWSGRTYSMTAQDLADNIQSIRDATLESFAAAGYTADLEYAEPYDGMLAGEACAILDCRTTVETGGTTVSMFQRQFFVAGKGFIFTITSQDQDKVDATLDQLNGILDWQ